jgi:hypothetical protein
MPPPASLPGTLQAISAGLARGRQSVIKGAPFSPASQRAGFVLL